MKYPETQIEVAHRDRRAYALAEALFQERIEELTQELNQLREARKLTPPYPCKCQNLTSKPF